MIRYAQINFFTGSKDNVRDLLNNDHFELVRHNITQEYIAEICQENVNIRRVRIFNTYGPNMALNDGKVVSDFIIQALKNENITIYGDGSQTRSFCYISDLTDGLIKMMNNKQNFEGPVNLGNPNERTVLELAELII